MGEDVMFETPMIQIRFTPKEWLEMDRAERASVLASIKLMAHSPMFVKVIVTQGHDQTQIITALPISDSEVWRQRAEEARGELASLREKVVETYEAIVRIIRGEVPLEDSEGEWRWGGEWG